MKFMQLMLSVLLCCALTDAGADEKADVIKVVTEKMPQLKIREVTKLPYGNLYEVVANGFDVFYADARAQVVIAGPMIELGSKRNLTDERNDVLFHIDWSQLPLDKAIVRVKGNGSRKLVLWTDPDCPYCKQLERELQKVEDVTIYTLLFPIAALHPDAGRKARLIWCAPDRAAAWDAAMLDGKLPEAAGGDCADPIRELEVVGDRLWITATPGVIFEDGRLVLGSLPAVQIEKLMSDVQKR